MQRPNLTKIDLAEALETITGGRPGLSITVSVGQPWDALLGAMYDHGAIVLELDHNERPVAAYRRAVQ